MRSLPRLLALLLLLAAGSSRADEAAEHFDKAIAPLLAKRCLDCHSGEEPEGNLDLSRKESAFAGGDSGAAIVGGKLDESLLWQRVADGDMPPKKPLPEEERAVLKAWLEKGAAWGADPIDPFRYTTESRAGYDWWSLQPLARPAVPEVNGANIVNPIDAFIQAKLAEQGLEPSPPAERTTLLRRVSIGLTGLPPSAAPGRTYEEDVDALLASPRYGERWARHWLDVARFGESQGFERDKLRPDSWRYRDWVVDAFNKDLPYDQFIRLQVAGDVLAPRDAGAIAATGFLVAGPWDEVGKQQQSAAMKAVVRQDELEDFVSVVGQTFLGLTVNCARCHDHKFDPILQREYYQLAAAMAGVEHGSRAVPREAVQNDIATAVVGLRARERALIAAIQERERGVREELVAEQRQRLRNTSPPTPIAEWLFDCDLRDVRGDLHGSASGDAVLQDGRLVVNGKSAFAATLPLERELGPKTLVAWVKLADLKQRGGGVMSVQTLDGRDFDAIVFGERDPGQWMAGSEGFARHKSFSAPVETDAADRLVQIALVYDADGTISAYRDGTAYGTPYKSSGLRTFAPGTAQVAFGIRHTPAGSNKLLAGAIDRAMLFDRALSPEEIAVLAHTNSAAVAEKDILARLPPEVRALRARSQFELEQIADQIRRYEDTNVYAVKPHSPHSVHVLHRGEPNKPRGEVTPSGIASLVGHDANFGIDARASDAERRAKLAAWLSDAKNPLTARVLVNRLWHYHFGVGLVETPNDFGFNGGRPSHPELLDWLARELIDSGWSVKHVQRLIVTSATYRQSSLPRAGALAKDADNRLLWRKSPQRLDAETLRDAMLFAAGELNEEMRGPGFMDFKTFVFNSQFYELLDVDGHTFHRRSLYRMTIRSGRSPLLDVFDCPDPSTKTPARAVTTTPLQALSLLNNPFVLRMSDALAARATREAGEAVAIARLYELTYGRAPTADELTLTAPFVRAHGLAALARVLVNGNEFLYVD